MTGSTSGLTVCGGYMRVVLSDSFSFATTRLCDLGNPEHAEDIVSTLAFLVGPLQAVLDTQDIPRGTFRIISSVDDGKSTPYEWVPDEDEAEWRILNRRDGLHGRRTVAVTGKARRKQEGAPVESIIIKYTWLPEYLVHYEQLVLLKIARATKEAEEFGDNPKLTEAMNTVRREILDYRPRSIGMLADCERASLERVRLEGA